MTSRLHGGPQLAAGLRRATSVVLALAIAAPAGAAARRPAASADEDARIVHALNRLTFGPRPGDVDAVRAMGLDQWIDQQLHPERRADSDLAPRLAALTTVRLSTSEILKGYDPPPELKREIQKRRAEMGDNASEEDMRKARRELAAEYKGAMAGPPKQVVDELQQAKLLRAVYSERQTDEVLVDFWMNHFNVFAGKGQDKFLLTAYERDVIRPHAWGKFEDLLRATAQSPAMLFYLDNWLSTDPNANLDDLRRAALDQQLGMGGRPARGMGRGRRGLGRRGRPGDDTRMRDGAPRPANKRKAGLNENYAREVMELHTLGVDGGYTQNDVTEVARCLTGWTIRGLRQNDPRFFFFEAAHDHGDKVVLGHHVKAHGLQEGEDVLHLLATHPSTARFISYKLARRFVADEPPAALVDRAAATFRKTDGDIREVVRTIVTSPEFFAPESRQAKVKTPLEFVVSAVRASGADVRDASALAQRVAQMGMPLYQQQPPTGYKDTAEAWVSTSGLLARLNFALDLAAGRVRGAALEATGLAPRAGDGTMLAEALAARLLPAGLSESTRKTLESQSGQGLDAARMAGLILGSPEFQRR
jgi:uncharacterized protein (DUF1800 family)